MGDERVKEMMPHGDGLAATRRKVKVLHQFICPITQELMREPVIAEDGHTYEKEAIESWLRKSPTSPMTRQQISAAKLIPNLALKQLIDQWKEEQRKNKGKAKLAHDETQPPLPAIAKAGSTNILVDEEDENENWRLVDEEELQAILEWSAADNALAVRARQQGAKEKEIAIACTSQAERDDADPDEAMGTGGWIAFAGAVAVVAGGVAWAATTSSSSSSSSSGESKQKARDEDATCIVS